MDAVMDVQKATAPHPWGGTNRAHCQTTSIHGDIWRADTRSKGKLQNTGFLRSRKGVKSDARVNTMKEKIVPMSLHDRTMYDNQGGMWISQCNDCRFRTVTSCEAFPEGIPSEVMTNKVQHDRPLPELGQTNDLVFEAEPSKSPPTG